MKNLLYSLVIFALAACQSNAQQAGQMLDVEAYQQKLAQLPNAQLVDVRTAPEFAEAHLPNAANIDVKQRSFQDLAAKLDKSKPVFVYCKMGSRSTKAAEILTGMGFTEVYNLKGGITDWTAAGKPIE